MTVRIHFAGLEPGRPLTLLAAAATQGGWSMAAGSAGEVQTARELNQCFGKIWSVAESIETCDVAVHAHGYVDSRASREAADECRRLGKPIVAFDGNETLPPTDPALGVVYRCSAFTRLEHERGMPVFVPDPTSEAGPWNQGPLERPAQPTVGFCGFAGSWLQVAGLRLVGASQKADGLALRLKVLAALKRDKRVQCDFRIRNRYLGQATFSGPGVADATQRARTDFLSNLFSNAYNISVRGKGNHSNRHYEIMAAGRIPFFVNTGCVLPLESAIDWRRHMVWVEAANLSSASAALCASHAGMDAERFNEMQQANRRLWVERLRPIPFFAQVIGALAAKQTAP
jgi:hypothetical protein